YASAGTIFFAACYRLTGRIMIAAPTAIAWFLTPQMLDINIGRADFLITLPLMLIFYASCVLALNEERPVHAIVLGAALAFAATIKINGLFFGILPVLAALVAFRVKRDELIRLTKFVALSIATFLIIYAALMSRYLYYLSPLGLLTYYKQSIELEL